MTTRQTVLVLARLSATFPDLHLMPHISFVLTLLMMLAYFMGTRFLSQQMIARTVLLSQLIQSVAEINTYGMAKYMPLAERIMIQFQKLEDVIGFMSWY